MQRILRSFTAWRGILWVTPLVMGLSAAHAQDSNVCGLPSASTEEGRPAPVSDLSLAYAAEQPAGPTTCSYGYLAAKCGDYATANRIFDKCIAKGYAGAMIWKGLLYENGLGVPQDDARATALFKQAADSGTEGYATLGKLHYASALHEGLGIERDTVEARRWFEAAAAEGSPDAQEFLKTGHHTGSRNVRGEGVGTPGSSVQGQVLRPTAPPPPSPSTSPSTDSRLAWVLGIFVIAGGLWQARAGLPRRHRTFTRPTPPTRPVPPSASVATWPSTALPTRPLDPT